MICQGNVDFHSPILSPSASCHFPIHISNFLRKLLIASIGETIGLQINFQNFLIKALHLRCFDLKLTI